MMDFVVNNCMFYNHLILSGTKIFCQLHSPMELFYNHLILSGTKIYKHTTYYEYMFYNHLILSGTKMPAADSKSKKCFTIT